MCIYISEYIVLRSAHEYTSTTPVDDGRVREKVCWCCVMLRWIAQESNSELVFVCVFAYGVHLVVVRLWFLIQRLNEFLRADVTQSLLKRKHTSAN